MNKQKDFRKLDTTITNNKHTLNKINFIKITKDIFLTDYLANKTQYIFFKKVDINYVYENIDKEYYINYKEVRKNILEKFKNEAKINEAIEAIDLYIDTIKSKGVVSEILSGKEIYDFFYCIKLSLGKLEKGDITVGLIAC